MPRASRSDGTGGQQAAGAHEHEGNQRRDIRSAETRRDLVAGDGAVLNGAGRGFFGVVGRRERIPFGPAIRASRGSWYEAGVLWALAFVDGLAGAALFVVTPSLQLSDAVGVSAGFLAVLRPVCFAVGGVLTLRLVRRRSRRVGSARAAALTAGVGLVAAALATSSLVALLASVVVAIASGALAAVVLPMLFDAHRPELRVRMVGGYVAAVVSGLGTAALVMTVAVGQGLTWRAALILVAMAPIAVAAGSLRLTDPPVGRWDQGRIGRLVEEQLGGVGDRAGELTAGDLQLSLVEQFRRVVASKSSGAILVTAGAFGAFAWGLPAPLDVFLRDRWALVAPMRPLAYGLLFLSAAPGVLWFAGRGEVAFRRAPSEMAQLTSSAALVSAIATALAAVAPFFGLTVVFLGIAFSAYAALFVGAAFLLLTLSDQAWRGHAGVLLGLAVLVGGLVGTQNVASFGTRFGIVWAMVIVAGVPLGVARYLGRSVATITEDVDGLIGRTVERHELAIRVSLGHHLPLLSCRNINFSYGQLQVLFDVSLTVDDGEMVALLGTNGAGKSTLLRLVSGLDVPSSGSIHYRGADVTFLSSERRVDLGISQIPGGRAVFGPLTVFDNLRAYGHSLGRDRARLQRGIDETFAALPRLAERRHQLASTLSGGERQMLALAKSYLLQPRLLLIDELSLGLAPVIVSELLEAVRQIRATGTAVVLVEQSVNIALSVADHAYFMEKGEVRFDGVAHELMERPDLLRSVFLQGASKGGAAVVPG